MYWWERNLEKCITVIWKQKRVTNKLDQNLQIAQKEQINSWTLIDSYMLISPRKTLSKNTFRTGGLKMDCLCQ